MKVASLWGVITLQVRGGGVEKSFHFLVILYQINQNQKVIHGFSSWIVTLLLFCSFYFTFPARKYDHYSIVHCLGKAMVWYLSQLLAVKVKITSFVAVGGSRFTSITPNNRILPSCSSVAILPFFRTRFSSTLSDVIYFCLFLNWFVNQSNVRIKPRKMLRLNYVA